jgi:DNA mismatch repair ATPase MutS
LTGRSYYIAEVEALLGLVAASADSSSHLFLLDELFRGTNAVERIAAGHAVLQELVVDGNRPKPHIVLAATHDAELVDLLSELFAAYHFGDAVDADGLVFDHRLQPGRATTRNAIALLRLHGAPDTLISRALTCAAALDRQRGTTVAGR